MLLRRARTRAREVVAEVRSSLVVLRDFTETIREHTHELRLAREQEQHKILAAKPFTPDLFEWDEQMVQSPGSYVQRMEWLQRVREWGRQTGYRWDAERARFVREPTQADIIEAEAEGRSLTYSTDRDGEYLVDCSDEVAKAYIRYHPDDPLPEWGTWATT